MSEKRGGGKEFAGMSLDEYRTLMADFREACDVRAHEVNDTLLKPGLFVPVNQHWIVPHMKRVGGLAMMMIGCVAFVLSVTVVLIPGVMALVEWAGFHDVLLAIARVMCGVSLAAMSAGLLVIPGWALFVDA
jgi:uncharacterized membrane protein